MRHRVNEFRRFVGHFFRYLLHVQEVLAGLLVLIVLGGVTISRVEGIELGRAIYFAFITGLTIGYGDITPQTALGSVVSVGIGLIGMVFTGITVAVATRALADMVKEREHHNG